jgi:hypothetical protein
MRQPPALRFFTALIALSMSAGVHAQAKKDDTMQLPIWNQASGKVEAVLLLEPADQASVGVRRRFSEGALDAAFGLGAGDSLGLLCDRKSGVSGAIGNLANHCLLASMGDDASSDTHRINATTGFSRNGGRVGLTVGSSQETLPAWLSPARGKVEQHDVTIAGEKTIGREGFVTIGGTVAKARIVSAADVPELADRWNTRSLTLGGGYGHFSGNIIGRVIDVPGSQGGQWQGLGLGFTWRTPWSGQLTVGAENVVTRGKNPFAAPATNEEQGTIPYVRYEQDL